MEGDILLRAPRFGGAAPLYTAGIKGLIYRTALRIIDYMENTRALHINDLALFALIMESVRRINHNIW